MQTRKLKKFQPVKAFCTELVAEGLGLSYIEEDQFEYPVKPLVGFIVGVLPGEKFVAEVRKVRSNHFHGVLSTRSQLLLDKRGGKHGIPEGENSQRFQHEKWALFKASRLRNKEACENFVLCGGCRLLHLSYEKTLEFKKRWFLNQIRPYSIDLPAIRTVKSPNIYEYRNHVQVHINKFKKRGFYSPFTYRVVPFPKEGCRLFPQKVLDENFPQELELERCVRVRINDVSNETLVTSLNSKEDKSADFTYRVLFPESTQTQISILNTTFFQINSDFIPVWLSKIRKLLKGFKTRNPRILELFSGFGFISKMLSLSLPLKSMGIDQLNPEAVLSTKIENSRIPAPENFAFFNENYIQHDLNFIEKLSLEGRNKILDLDPNVLILNPPRSGLPPDQIKYLFQKILHLRHEKVSVIYSSCNGATMARDLNAFSNLGYTVKTLELLDFFPWTSHYEILASLEEGCSA